MAGKLTKRRKPGFTVAVLGGDVSVSAKRRRASRVSKLFPGSTRKPPRRAPVRQHSR